MSVIIKDGTTANKLAIDTQTLAARTSIRPPQADTGLFFLSAYSGTIAASLAANTPLFSFRANATGVTVVQRIAVALAGVVAGVAGIVDLEGIVARSFSASDSGGTAITLTGNNQKKRTSYSTSGLADARIATTGTLTAGTRTLDAQGFGYVVGQETATAGWVLPRTDLFDAYQTGDGPLVLVANEGFILRNPTAWPGTGTVKLYVFVQWLEATTW